MARILITAFEPFGEWQANSSWLTLIELTRSMPESAEITTRLYPVDFDQMRVKLTEDLASAPDFCLHLGQAAGSSSIQLEDVALNLGSDGTSPMAPLVPNGPTAYRSGLPLEDWNQKLNEAGIPTEVSYHAGTYLCNGIYFTSCYLAKARDLPTRTLFVHLPLDTSQAAHVAGAVPSLPRSLMAGGIGMLVDMAVEIVRG